MRNRLLVRAPRARTSLEDMDPAILENLQQLGYIDADR